MSSYQLTNQESSNASWGKTIRIALFLLFFVWITSSSFLSRELIILGSNYDNKGDYDTAIMYYKLASWVLPTSPYPYYNRGLVYFKLGNNELALADFNKTIEFDPKCSSAFVGQCAVHLMQKEYDASIAECTEAIDLGTDEIKAYLNRGWAYLENEKYDLAILDFTKALEHKSITPSEEAYTYCVLGKMYALKGNFSLAIPSFEKGISLDSKGEFGWCKIALDNAQQGKSFP